ncbi:MAG: 3'-5' exonuclease [Anaeroplasmataceae bacterium]
MKKLKEFNRVLCFDVETSGLDFENDRIIEFAMIVLEKNIEGKLVDIVEEYNVFINVGFSIENIYTKRLGENGKPLSISNLTNITDEMLKGGISEKEMVDHIMPFLTDPDTLINGYNIHFDLNMVLSAIKRYYPNFKFGFKDNTQYCLDTFALFKDAFEWCTIKDKTGTDLGHKLDAAVETFKIDVKNTHRAIDDVFATWEVTKKILLYPLDEEHVSKNNGRKFSYINYYNCFGYNPKYKIQNPIDGITYIAQYGASLAINNK